MPFAEFEPSNAGAQLNDQILRNVEFGASLMERAQRGRLLERQLQHDATRLAADLATSNLRREQAQIALHQQRLDLQERERATRLNAELRAGFDHPHFEGSVESIRDLIDPAAQLGAISALRSSYARYRAVPELARLMDEQLGALEPVIAANQESRLHERIMANRYARTPEEAAQKFPGYRITPTVIPNGATEGGGRNVRLIYLAEDDVDPRLEAEAFHLLHNAAAWGDPAKLEALDRDPTVAAVLRVPGSKFAAAYIGAVAAARHPAPGRAAVAADTVALPPIAAAGALGDADPISAAGIDSVVPAPPDTDAPSTAGITGEEMDFLPLDGASPITGFYLLGDNDDPESAVAAGRFSFGSRSSGESNLGATASGSMDLDGAPPLFMDPIEPIGARWAVRKERIKLVPDVLKEGYQRLAPGRPSDVAFELARGSHLPVSTTLPAGAPKIVGRPLWINLNDRSVKVTIVTNPEIIADALKNARVTPKMLADYTKNQAAGEGEALLRGEVGPKAIKSTMPLTLRGGASAVLVRTAQGLTVLGVIGTTARMGTSLGESAGSGSAAPVTAQAVREAGGWGGALAGAEAGALPAWGPAPGPRSPASSVH